MRTFIRVFIALWYLLGWLSHVYLGLFGPETYQIFGETAIFTGFTDFWQNIVMPHMTLFALLLAGYELTTGLLLINKGKWVKIGLMLSICFNLFLIQMGLGYEVSDPLSDFSVNRLPNMIFIAIQIPLFWGWDNYSIPELIRNKFANKN